MSLPLLLDRSLRVSRYTHSENISLVFFSDTGDDLYYLVFGTNHPDIETVKALQKGCEIKLTRSDDERTYVIGPEGRILIRIERIEPA